MHIKKINIKSIQKNHLKFNENLISVNGWIKSIRNGKENSFVVLNDGSCFESLQVFFSSEFKQKELLKTLNFGSSIEIEGILKSTPERNQKFELKAEKINNFNPTSEEYPIQKKNLPISFIREYPQFRSRTNYFLAMFKLRSEVSKLINNYFSQNNFWYINTPIITSNDAEGGGESFSIENQKENEQFFSKKANLTVSGQLHAESLAQGLGKVYNFSPCFRAEKSNTTRHLSEFWMIEAEASFFDLKQIIDTAEKLIKYVISGVLKNSKSEITYFQEYSGKTIESELESILKKKFPRVTYKKSIEILKEKNQKDPNFFEFNEIFWGMDLNSEHEKYLCEHFDSPIFVINYPIELKAFYMKENSDKKTVSCMDLLFPKVGEMIGGSAREEKYEILKLKSEKLGLENENLNWYLELRKNGYAPSAGFGLGLERLLMFLSKSDNIKDTIAFPRFPNSLNF
ncbi:MAG: Asparagine--tRNA ligase [Mycoplasmataceae bacterium]|nr:MAG: Asparagine--tRNA ligase [Mycoplasmataceae bacterium]